MQRSETTWPDVDGYGIHTYKWLPDGAEPRAIVQICHGMAEHGGRYQRFAQALTDAGFGVYALDWRGHGQSCSDPSQLGNLGPNGFEAMVTDSFQLRENIERDWGSLPVFLFGHSMGSFAATRVMQSDGHHYAGVMLCGSQGRQGPALDIGIALARRDARRYGDGYLSNRTVKLTFAGYNRRAKPRRTPFDWLSRDEAEVAAYVADDRCGFGLTVGSLRDVFIGLRTMHRKTEMQRVPDDLPILLIAGLMDPVGGYGKSVRRLEAELYKAGVKDLTCRLYPGARHELLNERNRDDVTSDILNWMAERCIVSPV